MDFRAIAEHREAHQHLLRQIRETIDRVEHAEGVEAQSLLSFLRTWYSEHIERLDQPVWSVSQ